jgi:hypothetical protein
MLALQYEKKIFAGHLYILPVCSVNIVIIHIANIHIANIFMSSFNRIAIVRRMDIANGGL